MKLTRRDIIPVLEAISIQDQLGAVWTDKVRPSVIAIDFHLSEKAKEVSEYHKKVTAACRKALNFPDADEELTEDQVLELRKSVDADKEYTKWLDTNITIPVMPIHLEDLQKCRYSPSFFRAFYGKIIVQKK